MKILTIGRGENSHIYIDNPLVSRQHALLKIYGSGRMVIVDKSSNGTAINGSIIKKECECPVSRKDIVTFAGVTQLNWKEVPDPLKLYKIIGLVFVGIVVALSLLFGIRAFLSDNHSEIETIDDEIITPADTMKTAPKQKLEKVVDPEEEYLKWKRENRQTRKEEKKTSRQSIPRAKEEPKSPEIPKEQDPPKEENQQLLF